MMRRLLPYPFLALLLLLGWLVLQAPVSPGGVLLGVVMALACCWALVPLRLPRARLRRPLLALDLVRVVVREVVKSNLEVAGILLRPGRQRHNPGFVLIPLEIRDPYALTTLACIITATPGTVWVEYDSANGTMLMHVLDLVDPQDWTRLIKQQYETRLREMFE